MIDTLINPKSTLIQNMLHLLSSLALMSEIGGFLLDSFIIFSLKSFRCLEILGRFFYAAASVGGFLLITTLGFSMAAKPLVLHFFAGRFLAQLFVVCVIVNVLVVVRDNVDQRWPFFCQNSS